MARAMRTFNVDLYVPEANAWKRHGQVVLPAGVTDDEMEHALSAIGVYMPRGSDTVVRGGGQYTIYEFGQTPAVHLWRAKGKRAREVLALNNPIDLHNPWVVAGLVGGGALLFGGVAYALINRNCAWQVATLAAIGHPGHYRAAIPNAANIQGMPMPSDEASFVAGIQQIFGLLPGITIEGAWYNGLSFPQGSPVPSDWPGVQANDGVLRLQYITAYDAASAGGSGLPAAFQSAQVWVCPTGPVPATRDLNADLAAAAAQMGGGTIPQLPSTQTG
jgi:hypothetical protein